jgi:hypothetical protein
MVSDNLLRFWKWLRLSQGQNCRCAGRNSNLTPPKHKSTVLPLRQPVRSRRVVEGKGYYDNDGDYSFFAVIFKTVICKQVIRIVRR